jgi:hypothetical protein
MPRLRSWERAGLIVLGILVLAFTALVEIRSCFQNTRKTDFEVYARAAWAIRVGENIYQVSCSNHYHYTYPPAFAIVMAPFADAPAGAPRDGLMPFSISVAIWTVLNLVLVGRMAHVLAKLAFPNEERGSRRWWYARTVPVYIAFGGIGYSIGFGQVNVVLIAMLVEMLRSSLQEKRWRSGLWLAAAITMKVFPAYLLLYFFARRDLRALIGAGLGLIAGLAVIPMMGLGIERTSAAYQSYLQDVLMPGALGTANSNSVRELIDLPSNDSQSFLAVIHSNHYPDRASQPSHASSRTRLIHNMISGILTIITCWYAWRSKHEPMIVLGTLMILMLHITPMSHMHYYSFGYVLAAGLWLKGMSKSHHRIFPGWGVMLPLIVWAVGTTLPLFPGERFSTLRDRGLGLASSMVLWSAAIIQMSHKYRTVEELPDLLSFRQPLIRKAA